MWLVVSIHFVSFYVLKFVACDRNYDWRYTSEKRNSDKLINWLLNFIVRVLWMVLNCANGTKPTELRQTDQVI